MTLYVKAETKEEKIIAAKQGAKLINAGEVVAFPTETVYGLGALAFNAEAVSKIFKAKGRPSDNPLIVHVDSIAMASDVAELNEIAESLFAMFAPGPLTLVLPKKDVLPDEVTAGLNSVGVRIPNNTIALDLITKAGVPIAAPSANTSGKPSPTTGAHVFSDLSGKISMVIDGGPCGVGLESTVLDLTNEVPQILRPGAITLEDIAEICPDVIYSRGLKDKNEIPASPGMKYRHYAPIGRVHLLNEETLIHLIHDEGDLIIASSEVLAKIRGINSLNHFDLGSKENLVDVAQNIFASLRFADEIKAEDIYVEKFSEVGIGVAIMNRLEKAACKN